MRAREGVTLGSGRDGKSYPTCALAHSAIGRGHTALYVRTPRLLDDLSLGRVDGRYGRLLSSLQRVSLLVLDDFLLSPAGIGACRDLLEVIEDRSQLRSTIVVSQLPVDKWLEAMADPKRTSAIVDRILQSSHRIAMKGPSLRRRQPVEEGPTS